MGEASATGVGADLWSPTRWRVEEDRHHQRVDELTRGRRARAAVGAAHPVEDFLYTYYSLRPAQLRRWYPGAGVGLLDADERANWPFHAHQTVATKQGRRAAAVVVDVGAFRDRRGPLLEFIRRLLRSTSTAAGQFGCFGLHEWAMVYRQSEAAIRHSAWPLRLGSSATDDVVRQHQIRCSHYDAYRFFTPSARSRNLLSPDLASRERMEQPGCLHATMDLYKWAYKLIPMVPSTVLLDAFVLAREVRELDMRASPYDLTELGYRPVAIETAAGKAEYVAAQRQFADRGQLLRARLLAVLDAAADVGGA